MLTTEIVQTRKCWALEIYHSFYLEIKNILLVLPEIRYRGFRYNEQISPVPRPFAISRFYCTYFKTYLFAINTFSWLNSYPWAQNIMYIDH